MATDSPEHVYAVLRQAGFSDQGAVTMTAIAGAESGYQLGVLGDQKLQTDVWGPSVGLFQIRTLKADTGTGSIRDLSTLAGDELAQARAAYQISKGGRDFSPWTAFRTGAYRKFLQGLSGLGGAFASAAGNAVTAVTGSASGAVRNLTLTGAALLAGLGLIVAGALVAARPALQSTERAAVKVGKLAVLK
jgi:hypothetical protein